MLEPRRVEGGDPDGLFNQGLALHQAGQVEDARRLYDAALAIDPEHFDALHMLGVSLIQTGRLEQAVELIRRAIRVRSDVAGAYGNLANALNTLRRHDEAIESCDRAIALAPDYAEAHGNRGGALYQLGRTDEALESYARQAALRPADARAHFNTAIMLRALGRLDEALASLDRAVNLKPDYVEAHRTRGLALHELGRFDEALANHDRALTLNPDYADAWGDLGVTLLAAGRPQDALACFDRVLTLSPADAKALNNRGHALGALNRFDEALASYDRAIALRPDYAETYANRVLPLQALRRQDEALESSDRAIALKPDYADAHHNRASALYGLRRLHEAVASCDRALALKPDFAEAWDSRAVALSELGRLEEALESLERALALKPDYAEAHHDMAMCRLALGDYARGWAEYEWRWKSRQLSRQARALAAPLWLGREDIRGLTILLHAEQGLGDTLQFCRYVPRVAALGARVVLDVQPGLKRLLSRLDGVDMIIGRGEALPPHDVQTPLMSLPLALGAGPDGEGGPYLFPDPDEAAAWRSRLPKNGHFRVGLCWAGGARPDQPVADAVDRRRSLPLRAFAPLADLRGIDIYSLQMGPPASQLVNALARGWDGPPILDLTDRLKDFADTAALVANLDLVITCDTSTAHLAGGLGKPVWILNRFDACWRWLDGREDSPWYPSARLFRQTSPGDWDGVIGAVKSALAPLTVSPERRR